MTGMYDRINELNLKITPKCFGSEEFNENSDICKNCNWFDKCDKLF